MNGSCTGVRSIRERASLLTMCTQARTSITRCTCIIMARPMSAYWNMSEIWKRSTSANSEFVCAREIPCAVIGISALGARVMRLRRWRTEVDARR